MCAEIVSAKTQTAITFQFRSTAWPITGRGPEGSGGDITNSAEFEGVSAGLNVLSVKPGSYFERFFDLKAGDVVVTAGDVDLSGTDENAAQAFLFEAAQQKRALVVRRGGQKLTLQVKP